MPLYEFYCSDCRAKFELLTSYAASQADIACTRCGKSESVRKLISVVARVRPGGTDGYDSYGSDDAGDDGESDFGGGCSCGGACSCH